MLIGGRGGGSVCGGGAVWIAGVSCGMGLGGEMGVRREEEQAAPQ